MPRTLRLLPEGARGALGGFAEGLFGGVASALGMQEGSATAGVDGLPGVSQLLARVGAVVLASVLAAQVADPASCQNLPQPT
jgi:hypothetical protein